MQAESSVQMMSTHKCKKTYYTEARDWNIHSFEVDALIAPVEQDLIGGRAITNGLKFQVILDEESLKTPIFEESTRALAKLLQTG